MYGLDINFLKDREIRPVEASARTAQAAAPAGSRTPLLIGLLVAVAALGLVGGYWLLLQQRISRLEAREAELDQQIATIQSQLQQIETVQQQIALVEAENQAFVNVFNQIRPWSAFLKELRDRTPARIQIVSVSQTAGTTLPGPPTAEGATEESGTPPPVTGGVEIAGVACSFNDVNDFLLTLQRSPLLNASSVTIDESTRQDELLDPQVQGVCPNSPPNRPEILVDFTLSGNFTDVPSEDLLDVLDRQGAVGLATRIRALRDSGVIETP
ncbi:PilN domain-containing protein [Leptolyngbya iicbica]|uniref:Pilus assembly protein PilN n=2 Tax=Cyanophyceae TaxID=3028117 RepID=A0A4Q7E6V0_9CYAN|nr:PilN domain-containing protein [Leptolyngbya sp. LK]RZM77834.1 pilus assembly protein PilN [Leptolyngbya sp. LK]